MSILDSFPHRVTATRRVRSKGSLGGSRDDTTVVFSNRPCWRQSATAAEIQEFDKWGIAVTDKFYFTTNPGLDERHVLTIDGLEYKVVSRPLPDASAGLGVVWRVMAEYKTTEV